MMSRRHVCIFSLVLAISLGGCRDEPAGAGSPTASATNEAIATVALDGISPASITPPGDSQTPNLFVTTSGELLLTWLEPAGDDMLALRLARRGITGWNEPITIVRGSLFDNWADFPAVAALADGTLIATWLEEFSDHDGYGIRWARSIDEGESWSEAQTLHGDTSGPEYGFVSMALTPEGELAAFWLDGREVLPEGRGGPMQLRTAVFGREGPPTERRMVDDRICDCCQLSATSTAAGPVVAYRNRSVEEIRDIHVAGPQLRLGEAVHDDQWNIVGCPVNGPSLGAEGEQLGIAWFTAAADEPRVRAAFGTVGGSFLAPSRVDLGNPVGRVSLVMLDPKHAIVTFMERDGDTGEAMILARRFTAPGQLGPAHRVARTTAAHASGFPRSAKVGDTIVWAFTEVDDGHTRVRITEAAVSAVD